MTSRKLPDILREGRAAVRSADAGFAVYRGWQLLQEQGEGTGQEDAAESGGQARRMLPYTPQALAAFERAYTLDPDNIQLIHHLAIGYHAYAWDQELMYADEAPRAWTQALRYWRRLAVSAPFWAGMREKLLAIDPAIDPTFLDDARRRLLEDLLDIHVDFVRHYVEGGEPDRAVAHVRIIQAAELPPVVKNRFTAKVYAAMTSGVAEARAARLWDSALSSLERFLTLFPDYLPALRAAVEICKEWLSGMSYKEDWDSILQLGSRIEGSVERMAKHAQVAGDPLAAPALEGLTAEMAMRGMDRGIALAGQGDARDLSQSDADEVARSYELAIKWGRAGLPFSGFDSMIKPILAGCLNNRASLMVPEIQEISAAQVDEHTRLVALQKVFQAGFDHLDEAVRIMPDEELYQKNREVFSSGLDQVRIKLAVFSFSFGQTDPDDPYKDIQ